MLCRNSWIPLPLRTSGWFKAGVFTAALALLAPNGRAQTIWDAGSLVFVNSGGSGTDAITAQTALTRGAIQPIYNSVCESFPNTSCSSNPCNTQWAYGVIANWSSLTYMNLFTLNGCNPPSMVGQTMVCHLIAENIYLQITWNSWGPNGTGGFSYTRTTMPSGPPCPSPAAITPSSANYCTGAPGIALTASGAITYSWSPAAGLSATTGTTVTASPTTTTTYTVTGTGVGGCTNTATSTITVLGSAPVVSSTTATPSTICPGGSSQLAVNVSSPSFTYCVPPLSFGCGFPDAIQNVSVAGINRPSPGNGCDNLSGANGYSYFSSGPSGTLVAGSSGNPYSVTTGGDVEGATIWIDYNRDGAFGAGEQVFNSYAGTNPATYSGTFSVPAGAVNGVTRLRVRCTYNGAPGTNACGGTQTTYGETEDYNLTITGGAEPFTYAWSPATSLSSTTIANPMANAVTASEAYTVTVSAPSGCSATGTTSISVPTVDDGDPCTLDQCTGNGNVSHTFQDADGDGLCDPNDPCPNLAFLINGDPCDDGNVCTINDVVSGCVCAGTFQDTDLDGVCDANDNCPTVPGQQGSACDDGNPLTVGDLLTPACICQGQEADCLGVPQGPDAPGAPCNDNNACTINDTWSANCVCTGTFQDSDGDGTCDANDGCPTDPGKIAPGVCGCGVADTDSDGDGLANCVDPCPALANAVPGDACNDNNACTINDVLDASCNCVGTPAPATAGITASQPSYCTPGPGVVLTASGGATYSWAPATGLSATTGSPVTATPASATTYTVTATNTAGCSDTETITVGVGTTPGAPTATANPSTTCPGGSSQLNVQGASPALVVTISGSTYQDMVSWTLTNSANAVVGAGGPYGFGATTVIPIASPGPSPFVFFLETQGTFTDNVVNYNITCGGSSILSGVLTGGLAFTSAPLACSAAFTYSWSPATYLNNTAISNPFAANVMSTTTYTATSTTAAGCSSSTTLTLTVNPLAVPPINSVSATPNPVCPGSDAQLAVSTSAPFTYCVPPLSFGCSFPDQISNVNVAGIVRASGCDNLSGGNGYSLFAAPTGTLVAGSSGNPYSVTTSGDVEGATIWIDYNQNGLFGPGEQLFNSYAGTNPATYSGTFSVPASAVNGPTRLRVRCTYAGAPGTDACGGTQTVYGETEDYTVIITGGTTPYAFNWTPATYLSNPAIANPLAIDVMTAQTYTVTVTDIGGCQNSGTVSLGVETTDTDGDGTVDCADGCPDDANKIEPGQCGCGVPDTDTDGDLTADCNDGCPADPAKVEPGICGCGVSDVDTDSDGTADCNDLCPLDPGKIVPGACGCGVADTDGDADGIADCNDLCPSVPGTVGTPCTDGDPNTINDALNSSCVCEGTLPVCAFNTVLLDLVTDNDGSQTSWDVVNIGTTTVVCSGSGYLANQTITLACCLPNGCYELRVFDSAGDGMANGPGGGYVLRSNGTGNRRIIDNGGDGFFTSVSQIAANQGFCVPIGNDVVIAAHCDKSNWLPNDVIQATVNPLVTGQFGITNSTSGYQFWFFNPDGGYSRRVTQTHAAPGSVSGPPASQRAAYLRLSSLVTQPIPFYTNLNVRIRTQVAGVFGSFGPACRFREDPPCSTTQLTAVADPVVSCGATGLLLTSTIYATAVPGATTYQFEFTKPGYLRRIAQPVRSTPLSFVTNPLQNNNCYQVRVRISFDGGTTYCPFGGTCNITIGTALCAPAMPLAPEGTPQAAESQLTIWPNPNDGSLVNLSLTAVHTDVHTVLVEVTDVFGKLVSSRTIPVQDGVLRTTLALEQDIAPGLYLVNLQVGGERRTERLVIQR